MNQFDKQAVERMKAAAKRIWWACDVHVLHRIVVLGDGLPMVAVKQLVGGRWELEKGVWHRALVNEIDGSGHDNLATLAENLETFANWYKE